MQQGMIPSMQQGRIPSMQQGMIPSMQQGRIPSMQQRNSMVQQNPEEYSNDESAIGEYKDLSSRYDNMIKFRQESKKYYIKNGDTFSDGGSSSSSSSHGNGSSGNGHGSGNGHSSGGEKKIKYKSNITAEQLKDTPFREGELDDLLENNVSEDLLTGDDLSSSLAASLTSSNQQSSNRGSFPNLGDDSDNYGDDDMMECYLSKF
jgi:hypothetical protein